MKKFVRMRFLQLRVGVPARTLPLVVLLLWIVCTGAAAAQSAAPSKAAQDAATTATPPRVLIVVAHPDDETCFAATVYEITHNLGGTGGTCTFCIFERR